MSDYNFKNGDRVKFVPNYAGGEAGEVFTLTQWDGNKGFVADKHGRGWYVRGFQIEKARKGKGRRL